MGQFVGLPGVKGALNGPFVGTAGEMVRRLGKERVTSSAGDEGAMTAWVDDQGKYRANFCRHMSVIAETESTTKAGLRSFVQHWFPAMRDIHALSDAMKESA